MNQLINWCGLVRSSIFNLHQQPKCYTRDRKSTRIDYLGDKIKFVVRRKDPAQFKEHVQAL